MTKISKLNIYPLQSVVKGSDYVIGTDGDTKATKNFSAAALAEYVSQYINAGGKDATTLISVENIEVVDNDLTVTNAVYFIAGIQYGPDSGTVTVGPAEEGFYRNDIVVVGTTGEISIIQGVPSEDNAITPILPAGLVMICEVNVFGDQIGTQVPTLTGWKTYKNLVYLKRRGNFKPSIIQEGDPVWGVMGDGNTLIKGAPYLGTGNYLNVNSYSANPDDLSDTPATNTP